MRLREQQLGDKNLIGKNVAQLRKEQGLKQKDLLALLNVNGGIDLNASGLSKLEGQHRLVTDKELVALSGAFNVTLEKLLDQKI